MRKKSHISLSRYLIRNLSNDEIVKHKKAFYIGSVQPDFMPSFLTRKHTFEATFSIVQKDIEKIIEENNMNSGINRKSCRQMGVVTHYLADYFTFPHNTSFTGSFRDHCKYEKELKHGLKKYIYNLNDRPMKEYATKFQTMEELFGYVEFMHQRYQKQIGKMKEDIQFIVSVCFEVVDAILQFVTNHQTITDVIPQTVKG